jgi:hypothetical protein
MTREQRAVLRVGWLSFSLGTLISLTLNAGVGGCAARHAGGPGPANAAADSDPCEAPFLGATKAAPVVPPGCPGYEREREQVQSAPEQVPRQAQ